jgi:chlorite dismutase
MTADGDVQDAVRRAVDEITAADERLRVTHTVAALGWGDVLYVDVYARSPYETLNEEFDPELRKRIASVAAMSVERVTIRWRISS